MKNYIQVILLLFLPLAAVMLYSLFADTWDVRLKKVSLDGGRVMSADTPVPPPAAKTLAATGHSPVDTAHQRILFLGDSMVEGLGPRMGEYCAANGHDLTYVCWYSSTSLAWASDTLRHYLDSLRPSFVIMTLGGNEQQTRDFRRRRDCVRNMVDAVGDVPLIWISTPAWNTDATFNAIPRSVVGDGRFFDSDRLTLERSSDHKHPTFAAARIWMDSIAAWMSSSATAHPIRMDVPPKGTAAKYRGIFLRPKGDGRYVHEERVAGAPAAATQKPKVPAMSPQGVKPGGQPQAPGEVRPSSQSGCLPREAGGEGAPGAT